MKERIQAQGLTRQELAEITAELGEPKYRAGQIFSALHNRRVRELAEITDLPKSLREKLAEKISVQNLVVESRYISVDGTRRFLMKTHDGFPVETVFIPTEN